MICKPFDVVEVPFPFSDLPRAKRRKALVLSEHSFSEKNGCSVLTMITSATHSDWDLDMPIVDWDRAGLRKPCVVRLKVFTLDNGLIVERSGHLSDRDKRQVIEALRAALPAILI